MKKQKSSKNQATPHHAYVSTPPGTHLIEYAARLMMIGSGEFECEGCDKEFFAERIVTVEYTTRKLKVKEGAK